MRRIWFCCALVAVAVHFYAKAQNSGVGPSSTQGPESGKIVNNVYVNDSLAFSFPIPAGWQVNGNTIGPDGEVRAIHTPGGGLILLIIDHHTGGPFLSRIVLSALDGKNSSMDTQGFVSKFVSAEMNVEGMSLVRDAFPVDYAGKHFFREDFKESSDGKAIYKAFIGVRFRGYFLGWLLAAGSPSELEQAAILLEKIEFGDEPATAPETSGLPGTVPGDPPKGIVAGVISSSPRQSPSGRLLRVRVSQGVAQGLLVKRVRPEYPEEARQGRIQGQVVLQVEIDTNGGIENATLVSGHPLLAPAAIEAVKQWKYKPYLLNGQPVIVETQIVVNFELSR